MELRALRYFLKVYEQGSVSGAAKHCFVSQPSITTAIQSLENSLNTALFVRHARGVLPTAAAEQLYPKAKQLVEQEKLILNMFRDTPSSIPLRIGIMRSMGAKRMSQLLRYLSEEIENLELTLVDPEEPCDARIMAVTTHNASEQFVPIWQDEYLLGIPAHWPLAQHKTLSIPDLQGMAFIHREPCKALERLKELMLQQGGQLHPRANIRTIDYAWPLVSAGVGSALLPNWKEITRSPSLSLKVIEGFDFKQSIGLVVNHSQKQNILIQRVVETCRKFAMQEV